MTRRPRSDIPVVFISSTSEDLKKYREAARDAALGAKFHPEMMESFIVSGARPPLAECQAKVAQADVAVVIVAHRYGWVPADQRAGDHKNICWLECEAAINAGQELLAFILDDNHPWPSEAREEQQLVAAVRDGKGTPELLATVQQSVSRLRDFKAWLNGRGIRALFTTPEDLRGKVSDALREWRSRQAHFDETRISLAVAHGAEDEGFVLQKLIWEAHARDFIGRVSVQHDFDNFLQKHSRGYFIVRAEPGQGKTALSSHLVKTRGLVHHFIRRGTGRADARLILSSLIVQLALRKECEPAVPDTLPERVRRLENLIANGVSVPNPLVLVIDALDELPDDADRELPFLVTEGLPTGAYFMVTCRPGDRCDDLVASLKQFGVPYEIHKLNPLNEIETRRLLQAKRPGLSDTEIDRIASASEGSPLYLTSVVDAIEQDPAFDLQRLPPAVEGIFERALEFLSRGEGALARQVLGLLTVARKPLSLGELCEISGQRNRQVDELALNPVRQFLHEWKSGFTFYHSRFRDFLLQHVLYDDDVADCHRLLADWLCSPKGRSQPYRWTSLAFHLFGAGDRDRLAVEIDSVFLREKTDRCGYDVLEDIELLSRAMLDTDDPQMVSRCAAMVEELRAWVGGDLVQEARRTIQGIGAADSPARRPVAQTVPLVPGIDAFAVMLPKLGVGADFVEFISREGRLVIAIGDAPGIGLRGAFVARFIANLFRRLVSDERCPTLSQILQEIDRRISSHEFFERVTMLCVEVDPKSGTIAMANAGAPHPIVCSARRGKCDRLVVQGTCLFDGLADTLRPPHFELRRAEFDPGDLLVLLTDGITEGHRLDEGRYGYRFLSIVEQAANRTAKGIGEAILADWAAHPRDESYFDDVTLVVIAAGGPVDSAASTSSS